MKEQTTIRFSVLALVLLVASTVLPHLVSGEGLAAAASAALTFLALYGVGTLLALWVVIRTGRSWSELGSRSRALGVAPLLAAIAVPGVLALLSGLDG